MFQVLAYTHGGEKLPQDYSVATLAQAQHPDHRASVKQACSSAGLKEGQEVRLKNGLLRLIPGEHPFKVKCRYRQGLEYRLISKPKLQYSGEPNSGKELITKEDCLIALAYAAEHDDVDDEVEELVQCAGKEILSTRMPFAFLGTILHVCINWASINLLEKVLRDYPESVDVYILDRDEDTALHNLPNEYRRRPKSYDECKRAACLLLGHHGVNVNELLSKQNNYGRLTALSKALVEGKQDVCRGLLDAAKEMEEKEEAATISTEANIISKAPHWLTLKVNDRWNTDDIFLRALHLAVLQKYDDIVAKILAYPGAKGLNLTSLQDHKGNTPLHAVAKVGHHDICSMLLKYSMEINTDAYGANVRSQNKAGKTPLLIAATHGYTEVCEKLLEYGAPLDLPDKHGKYALTNAFTEGHKSVVERLLDACLPATVQNAESEAKSELSVINTKSKHNLINEQFELGFTPLHVAVAISSEHHISNLLKAGAWVDSTSDDGRTPLHVATQQYDKNAFFKLLEETKEFNVKDKKKGRKGWINMKDILGQTALHNIVRLSGQSAKDHLSESGEEESSARDTESSEMEITEEGNIDGICDMVTELLDNGAWVDLQDCHGETALHVAARRHEKVVRALLESNATTRHNFRSNFHNRDKWIAMCDFSGETALHEAARTGCLESVQHLLNQTQSRADLLRVRDMENMTALDWAAQKESNETMIDEMMRNLENTDKITKDFLMWNLKQHINPHYHRFLCKSYEVEENQASLLLQAAVEKEDVDIARELINRGANVPSLEYNHRRWLAQNLGKKASDQPTSDDTLDRKALVQGVANLLLNPYTETPVTIGIFGSWGAGKSSFMLQVEEAMLHMAVKETFRKTPYTLSHDKESSSVLKFSRIGAILRCKVVKALQQRMRMEDKYNQGNPLFAQKRFPSADQITLKDGNYQSTWGNALLATLIKPPQKSFPSADIENHVENLKDEDDIITRFPMELQSKYRQLFKDLALSDRSKLVRSHAGAWYKRDVGMNNQALQDVHLTGYTPAVLTLHYNAWQYDNKTEASAGLAVEISHQLESFMTPHQWLRMCWKYSWNSQPRVICVQLLLPALLALVVVCVVLILWKLTPIATKYKALSLPMGIVGVMWVFFKTSLKVIQPVTQTMLNNPKSIDHQAMLGYQHQVIHDIKFLKDQLCHDAHCGWKIVSFFCQLFISNKYFMEGTWIWKQHPRLNNFRMVVFIDDLDRCDEKTILEILRATNLILGSCGISAVIGVDKGMVQRAIIKEFLKDTGDKVLDIWAEDSTDNKAAPDLEEKGPQAVVQNVDKKTIQEEGPQLVVDKKTIQEEKASQLVVESNKKAGNDDKLPYTRDLADKYLQKIIQLPIEMPDPSRKHIEHFLEGQVGKLPKDKDKDKQKKKKRKSIQEEKDEGDIAQSQADVTRNGTSDPIVFRLLLANYTPMEKDMLKDLCQFTTNEQAFPREWKRFLNYHRLAWTILSQDHNMKSNEFKGWQRKLILWIFICWNWRDQMDVIFEKWHDIISKSSKLQAKMHLQEKVELCDIIDAYMKSKGWSTKEDVNQNRGKKDYERAPKAWIDLYKKLKDEYDIPMHFTEKFQQFRFYCKLNHLEIDEHHKVAHLKSFTSIKPALRLGYKICR